MIYISQLFLLFLLFTSHLTADEFEHNKPYIKKLHDKEWVITISKYGEYLYIYNVATHPPKTLGSYKLGMCSFCEGEDDECYKTGAFAKEFSFYPNPVILLSCKIGAHSARFMIIDPEVNKSEPILSVSGSYYASYKIKEDYVEIQVDRDRGEKDLLLKWPRPIDVLKPLDIEDAIAKLSEPPTIHPIEIIKGEDFYAKSNKRQRIEDSIKDENSLDSVVIYMGTDLKKEVSSHKQWIVADIHVFLIGRGDYDQEMLVTHNSEEIYYSSEYNYDHVVFNGLCEEEKGIKSLTFTLMQNGSGNGHIEDMLFIYYDKTANEFQHKIIENRYLTDGCGLKKGLEKKYHYQEGHKKLKAIQEQLRPSKEPTIFSSIKSDKKLSVRPFEVKKLRTLLNEFKQYITSENENNETYFNCSMKKLAENAQWSVVEVIYSASGSNSGWGVLLVKNRQENQWFSFYNIPVGGSKIPLHTPQCLELVGDGLRGSFCTECDTGWGGYKSFEIDLKSFNVIPTHDFRF